jgi:predicted kinase
MATLHLMCGLPAAGKTTLARQLERALPALRLTPDEWITRVLGAQPPQRELDAAREPFEALQWEVASRALPLGVNVILDFGFWSRAEREDYQSRAHAIGAGSEVHYVEAPIEVLESRLARRLEDGTPDTFQVTQEQLLAWAALFEPPSADELVPRAPGLAS